MGWVMLVAMLGGAWGSWQWRPVLTPEWASEMRKGKSRVEKKFRIGRCSSSTVKSLYTEGDGICWFVSFFIQFNDVSSLYIVFCPYSTYVSFIHLRHSSYKRYE
jgi:hypothetical protein